MFQGSIVAQQDEPKNKMAFQMPLTATANPNNQPGFIPDTRREQMAMNFHIKNRKRFTHLYELEKHFR